MKHVSRLVLWKKNILDDNNITLRHLNSVRTVKTKKGHTIKVKFVTVTPNNLEGVDRVDEIASNSKWHNYFKLEHTQLIGMSALRIINKAFNFVHCVSYLKQNTIKIDGKI